MEVLIIDYWNTFIQELKEHFHNYKNEINIRSVDSKKRALDLIKKKALDLVIVGHKNNDELDSLEVLLKLKAMNQTFIVILLESDKNTYNQILDLHPLAIFSLPIDILALKLHIDNLLLDRKTLIPKSSDKSKNYLIFSWNSKPRKEKFSEIFFIHTDGNYIKIHLSTNEFLIRHTLKGIEEKLPKELFIRTHRNYIVNISLVRSIDISTNIVHLGKFKIPIGRKYKKGLIDAFSTFRPPEE